MTKVCQWGKKVEVAVSKEKTVQMLLKGRINVNTPPRVRCQNICVKYVTEVKYLGVHINERLSFATHINKTADKISSAVYGLQRVMRQQWGLSKKIHRNNI